MWSRAAAAPHPYSTLCNTMRNSPLPGAEQMPPILHLCYEYKELILLTSTMIRARFEWCHVDAIKKRSGVMKILSFAFVALSMVTGLLALESPEASHQQGEWLALSSTEAAETWGTGCGSSSATAPAACTPADKTPGCNCALVSTSIFRCVGGPAGNNGGCPDTGTAASGSGGSVCTARNPCTGTSAPITCATTGLCVFNSTCNVTGVPAACGGKRPTTSSGNSC